MLKNKRMHDYEVENESDWISIFICQSLQQRKHLHFPLEIFQMSIQAAIFIPGIV